MGWHLCDCADDAEDAEEMVRKVRLTSSWVCLVPWMQQQPFGSLWHHSQEGTCKWKTS